MSITFTDNLNAMAALSTTTTVAPSRAAICGDSAVLASENTDSAMSDVEREALDEGADYFQVQGAAARERLS